MTSGSFTEIGDKPSHKDLIREIVIYSISHRESLFFYSRQQKNIRLVKVEVEVI